MFAGVQTTGLFPVPCPRTSDAGQQLIETDWLLEEIDGSGLHSVHRHRHVAVEMTMAWSRRPAASRRSSSSAAQACHSRRGVRARASSRHGRRMELPPAMIRSRIATTSTCTALSIWMRRPHGVHGGVGDDPNGLLLAHDLEVAHGEQQGLADRECGNPSRDAIVSVGLVIPDNSLGKHVLSPPIRSAGEAFCSCPSDRLPGLGFDLDPAAPGVGQRIKNFRQARRSIYTHRATDRKTQEIGAAGGSNRTDD